MVSDAGSADAVFKQLEPGPMAPSTANAIGTIIYITLHYMLAQALVTTELRHHTCHHPNHPFPPPLPLPLLRGTPCALGWPSATPDDGPPRWGDRCVSPVRWVVSVV